MLTPGSRCCPARRTRRGAAWRLLARWRNYWPAFGAALAKLSGGLDDAETEDELADAVRHGLSLISA